MAKAKRTSSAKKRNLYRADFIENGERFFVLFRANSAEEAKEYIDDPGVNYGGECLRLRMVPSKKATLPFNFSPYQQWQ